MEDVDCVVAARRELNEKEMQKAKKREKDALSFVSLSGLLNVLDGLQAPHGVMFFMTTNKVEVLDEALQRPGRIDIKELIGPATLGQKTELYQKFFPETLKMQLLGSLQVIPTLPPWRTSKDF